jgi:hypothetical protein
LPLKPFTAKQSDFKLVNSPLIMIRRTNEQKEVRGRFDGHVTFNVSVDLLCERNRSRNLVPYAHHESYTKVSPRNVIGLSRRRWWHNSQHTLTL